MNILILSWRGPKHPHEGGAEIVIHEHAKAWIKAGHQVTLFTSTFNKGKDLEIIDGVRIIRGGSELLGVHIRAFFWYLFSNKTKYDLVVDNFHGIPFFTPIYIRVKKIGFIHEVTKEIWYLNNLPKPSNLILGFLGKQLEPWIFKLLYRNIKFITVSQSTKDDLKGWGINGKNIYVILNGLIRPSGTKYKKKSKALMYLGALSRDKGVEIALEIFSKFDLQIKDFEFWIVGKGEEEYVKKIKDLAFKLNILKKVKFFGFVPEKKKFELLSKAYLLINPSFREGWGLVVIEAASCMTPTVAFDVAGLKDSIINNKTGVIVKERNSTEFANQIIKLIKNEGIYHKMSLESLKWSKNFSWKKATLKSTNFIKNI